MNPLHLIPWTNRRMRRAANARSRRADRVVLRVEPLEDRLAPAADLGNVRVFPSTAGGVYEAGHTYAVLWAVDDVSGTGSPWSELTAGSWTDRVLLSTDSTADSTDRVLGTATVSAALAPFFGNSYLVGTDVTFPADVIGDFYLLVESDASDQLPEPNEGNNAALQPATVIAPLPPSELEPTALSTTGPLVTGGSVTVNWAVINTGPEATRPAGWRSIVYYSADDRYDPTDRFLATDLRNEPLEVAATATFSQPVVLPDTPGDGYLLLVVDPDNYELETNETNNTRVLPVALAGPDLVPTELTVTGPLAIGATITLDWVDTNAGPGAAPFATWTDLVYYSADAALDNSDTLLAYSFYSGALVAGEPLSFSQSAALPNTPGTGYLLLVTDAYGRLTESDETNNIRVLQVSLAAPDLTPTEPTVTGPLTTGATITLNWQDTNTGTGLDQPAEWWDQVYFSANEALDDSDELLTTVSHFGTLGVGAGVAFSRTVTLPNLPGSGYLFVVTDVFGQLTESDETNNTRALPITIAPPLPDLTPVELSVTGETTAGGAVTVGWAVTNSGTGPAAGRVDRVYLSADDTLDPADVSVLEVSAASLNTGQSAPVSRSLTLPDGAGTWYLILAADANGTVAEADETNNTSVRVLTITPRLGPNLRPTALTVAGDPLSGQPVTVSWSVTSDAAVGPPVGWQDRLYFSADATLNATDPLLAEEGVFDAAAIAAGATYHRARALKLPTVPGYIFLVVDADGRQSETNEADNVRSITTGTIAADLVVNDFQAPAEGDAGQTIDVAWQVTNAGTLPFLTNWTGRVYLSTDDHYDTSDLLLAFSSSQPDVEANQTLAGVQGVTLPTDRPAGDYYLVFRAEPSIYLGGTKDGPYGETRGDNNERSAPFRLRVPDLRPIDLTAPTEVTPGTPVTVTVAIENRGAVPVWQPTSVPVQVWFARDPAGNNRASATVLSLGYAVVAPGGQVFRAAQVYVPTNLAPGTYYVGVTVGDNTRPDADRTNDTISAAVVVPGTPTSQPPDFVPSVAQPSVRAYTGVPFTFSFSTTNAGAATQTSLTDIVYFSTDDRYDPTDVWLGYVTRSASSAAPWLGGESQIADLSITIPANANPGPGYLLVYANRYGYGGESNVLNNVLAVPVSVAAPSAGSGVDIGVSLGSFAGLVTPGQSASVTWVGKALTGTPTTGAKWYDRVYLSADTTFDAADLALKLELVAAENLAADGTYTRTSTFTLPDDPARAGYRYLLVVANADAGADDPDRSNNTLALPVAFRPAFIPDLKPYNFSITSTPAPGNSVQFSGRVQNAGTGTARGSWYDAVYLSRDNVFDGTDTLLSSDDFGFSGGLQGGGWNYGWNWSVQLPATAKSGDYLLYVTDRANVLSEASDFNNVVSARLTFTDPGLPDLQITQAAASATTLNPNDRVTVTWTGKNAGNAAIGTSWADAVYLSDDAILDPADTYLGDTSGQSGGLAAGASYSASRSITTPTGKGIGDKYLLVAAGRTNFENTYVAESDETNNTRAIPITLRGADLTVATATVSNPNPATGQSVTVAWEVRNAGNEPALAAWADAVYYSVDQTFDRSTDVYLGQLPAGTESPLEAGEVYAHTAAVTLPQNLPAGAGYLLVVADQRRYSDYFGTHDTTDQSEADEGNNVKAVPVTIRVPDLVVSEPGALPEITAGQSLDLSWKVTNTTTVAAAGGWSDRVYVSADSIFDSTDTQIARVDRTAPLAAGAAYTAQATVTAPDLRPGSYYLLYVTDAARQVTETGEANNVVAVPVVVHAPDLIVTAFSFPTSVTPGEEVFATWTVKNVGDVTAPAWDSDRLEVYGGEDDSSSGDRRWFTVATPAYDGPALAPGAEYTRTVRVTVPAGVQPYHHSPYNQARVTVNDYSYGHPQASDGDGGNDTFVRSLDVRAPNLRVSAVTAPPSVSAGQTYTISWEVTNNGPGEALAGWSDGIYLATSLPYETYDYYPDGVRLAVQPRPAGTIAAGGKYTATAEVTIPANTSGGTLYFLVYTDVNHEQGEQYREKNYLSAAVDVGSANLVIDSFTAPATAQPGQTVEVSWTVRNAGTTNAVADWTDRLVLRSATGSSYYATLTDASVAAQTPLAPGVPYTVTRNVTIPATATGPLLFELRTDAEGRQGETNEGDNSTTRSVTVSALPDLTIESPVAPMALAPGQSAEFSWVVKNLGPSSATAAWSDAIYLSVDDALDASDLLVLSESAAAQTPLASSSSYSVTRTVVVPPATPAHRYLLFVANANKAQGETDESNNARAVPVSVRGPDLTVSSVSAPAAVRSGESFDLTWTLTNTGSADATGTWTDRVYTSRDRFGVNTRALGDFRYTGTIRAGETITRVQSVSAPLDLVGSYYLLVEADVGDGLPEQDNANNTRLTAAKTVFGLQDYPNLKVLPSISVPSVAFSGRDAVIEWTVTNVGAAATSASIWYDRVWLSTDATLDAADTLLGDVANPAYLPAGEAYNSSLTARLPRGIEGTYYVLVEADQRNQVFELGRDADNRTASAAFTVTLTPPPDLRVTNVVAPANTFSGQPTTVSWTVTNAGTGPTEETLWYDEVYLSTNATLDSADRSLGRVARTGALSKGEPYTASLTVGTPIDVQGAYYFLVRTDSLNHVFEHAFEGNNVGHDDPTTVNLTPPPDLEVVSVTGPETAVAGRPLTVNFAVANFGAGEVPGGNWSNAVYLSTSATFDPATARLLGTHGGASGPVTYTLPADLPAGAYFVYVVADNTGGVFESDETNNTGRSAVPVAITSRPTDLRVTSVTPAATAEAGQTLAVAYTVTNAGVGETLVGGWTDQLVAVAADGTATTLGTVGHSGILAAGASYTQTVALAVPFALDGSYTLTVRADAGNVVYESDEANNAGSAPLAVTRRVPDLTVSDVAAVGPVAAGGSLAVLWKVTNSGVGITPAAFWYDRVVLTTDGRADAYDLGTFRRTNPLGVGESYTPTATFTVPANVAPGTYFVRVYADTRDDVSEPGGEGNNAALSAGAVAVTAAPAPTLDLAVTTVAAPTSGIAGQPFAVSWTVRNNGPTIAGPWYDAVYLSLDDTLDRRSDVYLGYVDRLGTLGTGETYTATLTGNIPAGLTGAFTVFVIADGGNRVTPEVDEENNVGSAAEQVVLTLQPPADLVAGDVVIPATATPGQTATVTYSVTNAGPNPAVGSWYDNLFLSADGAWDLGDAFLGRVLHTGDVAAGASYSETLTAALPGVTPGTYKLIVRSDARNQVRETSDRNNTFASVDRFAVDVPGLALGVSASGALADGQAAYYRVDVGAGEALLVTFDGAATDGTAELYVRFGAPPTRTEFDVRSEDALAVDQRALVGRTQAGTYYILAYGGPGLPSGSYQIEAKTVQFRVFDTGYGKGGTAGNRTIEINGAKFDRTVTAHLVGASGVEVAAVDYYRVSDSKLYATFDLTAVAPGTYDVRLRTADGRTATVTAGMEVVRGGGANVQVVVDAPDAITRPRTDFPFVDTLSYQFTVSWSNTGLNDAPAPVLSLISNDEFGYSMSEILDGLGMQDWTFYAASTTGRPGVLSAGGGEVMRLTTRNSDIPIPYIADITYSLTRLYKDESAAFDWEPFRADLRDRSGLSDADFNAAFARLVVRVGGTNGDFLRMLSQNAGLIGVERQGLMPLVEHEFEQASADVVGTSVRGAVTALDFAVQFARKEVIARNKTTGDVYFARVDTAGGFVLVGLSGGTYAFEVADAVVDGNSTFTVPTGVRNRPVELAVSSGAALSGRVNDSFGAAVPGATVTVRSGEYARVVRTDARGAYAVEHLPAGTYTVTAYAPGFTLATDNGVPVGADAVSRTFQLAAEGRVRGRLALPGGSTVVPRVLAVAGDGLAHPVDLVTVDGDSFSIRGLAAGIYTLEVNAEGYLGQSIGATTVAAGGDTDVGILAVVPAASVAGTVTVGGSPAAGRPVVGISQGEEGLTAVFADDQGRFRLADLAAGDYTLRAVLPSGQAVEVAVSVTAGEARLGVVLDIPASPAAAGSAAGPAGSVAASGFFSSLGSAWDNYWTSRSDLEAEKVELKLPDPPECPTPAVTKAYEKAKQLVKVADLWFDNVGNRLDNLHSVANSETANIAYEAGKLVLNTYSFISGVGSLRGLFALSKNNPVLDVVLSTYQVVDYAVGMWDYIKSLKQNPKSTLLDLPATIDKVLASANLFAQAHDLMDELRSVAPALLNKALATLDTPGFHKFADLLGKVTGLGSLFLGAYNVGTAIGNGLNAIFQANEQLNQARETYKEWVEKAQRAIEDYERVNQRLGDEAKVKPDHYRTSKNHALNISPRGVLANDTGVNCGDMFVNSWGVGPIVGGSLITFNREGGFRFQPTTDFVGTASFDYVAYRKVAGKPSVMVGQGHVTIEVTKEDKCEGDSCEDSEHREAKDPNDIIGPSGYGDERWVAASDALPYTVRFENDPTLATAPAQVVRITQTLDSDLDPRTFRLGDFGFGDTVVDVPDNRAFYQTRLDLRDKYGVFVDVAAGVNVATAEVFWEFRAVDPATGDVPANPLVGFLPPNTDGSGQGFASYTVKAKKDSPTGTRVDAQARIIFDINEPIDTPPIFNTLDASPPAARPPAATTPADGQTGIAVSWAATDDASGVGVRDYTVYVTDVTAGASAIPVVWLEGTTATGGTFDGLSGHTYTFTVVARDLAGNATQTAVPSDPVVVPGPADVTPPTSSVAALAAESEPRFLVSWQGADGAGGSGVATFDVYAATDGGAFTLWQNDVTATSAHFDGQAGKSYSFFSMVTDRAGNSEPVKTAAEATTTVPAPAPETGGISGTLFEDLNADGIWQEAVILVLGGPQSEPGLGGWTMFLDADGDGVLDAGEVRTTTAADGSYEFRDLPPGTYTVAADRPEGWFDAGLTPVGLFVAVATVEATPTATASTDCGCGKSRTGGTTSATTSVTSAAATTPATAASFIGIDRLRTDPLFATADGRGTAIVFLDTGLAGAGGAFGPDANGDGTADAIVYQYDYVEGDFVAQDASGHGTGVAALATGVAPGASLIVLRVLDAAGRGDFGNVEKALQWVAANAERYNIVAVNMSFGDGTGQMAAVNSYGLGDEFADLATKGLTVVAAAGNNHATRTGVAYPAADPNVLAVGAVFTADRGSASWADGARDASSGPDRIASFSQRDALGATLFAPGAYVATVGTTGAGTVLSGTSAAVPQVAGAVAVAQQLARQTLGRFLTPTEVRSLLASSGVAIRDGDDEQDNVANTGATYYRLDVYALAKAVSAFRPGDGVATPVPAAGGSSGGAVAALSTGRTVVVTAGQTSAGADIGLYRAAEITGRVFDDADGDGVRDEGEGGLSGVTVFLDADGDAVRDEGEPTTATTAGGGYSFGGLRPGTYTVRAEAPDGRVPTTGASGYVTSVASGRTAAASDFGLTVPDSTPPAVVQFVVQNGLASRANVDRVAWRFSEDAAAADLIASGQITSAAKLFNLTTGTEVALTAAQFRYDAFTRTLTWALDAFTGRTLTLPDGAYEWRLGRAAFADAAGNPLATGVGSPAGDAVAFRAHRLAGDVTGDGETNAADGAAVAQAIGARPGQPKWDANLDVDRDGLITARDRLAVAKAQGGVVSEPVPVPATGSPSSLRAGSLTDLTPVRLVVPVSGTLRIFLAPPALGSPAIPATPAELVVRLDGKEMALRAAPATEGRTAVEVPVVAGQVVTLRVRGTPGVAYGFDALLAPDALTL